MEITERYTIGNTMKKFIVITSIFEPTEAVKKFAKINDSTLIVIGDKKSPKHYHADNTLFFAVDKEFGYAIEEYLPYNHYSRKMLGYLYAMQNKADIIIDTDDDNIPLENWKFPEFSGNFDYVPTESNFVNIYKYFSNQKIWPRGLPLNLINEQLPLLNNNKTFKIGFWQGLADADPDVDAIYRLLDNTPCFFDKNKAPIVLDNYTYCPFNTQNTACIKDMFPLLYLPSTVTFRFTDILKSLVAQPIMNLYNFHLGFTTATVFQERNEHDYMKDFQSEIPCYLYSGKVIEIVNEVIKAENNIYDNLYSSYLALLKEDIVKSDEMRILESWISDCKKLLN